jgi:hypothetical protein
LQFFQNYKQDCLKLNTCQNQIVNIDDVSTIALYQLATVGVVNSLSVNQKRASSRPSCSCHILIALSFYSGDQREQERGRHPGHGYCLDAILSCELPGFGPNRSETA